MKPNIEKVSELSADNLHKFMFSRDRSYDAEKTHRVFGMSSEEIAHQSPTTECSMNINSNLKEESHPLQRLWQEELGRPKD